MKKIILVVVILFSANCIFAQTEKKLEKKQFIYVLHLEKAMYDSSAWTPEKKQIVAEHFAHLQKMLADGKLILGGRTDMPFDNTFGIVIFEADNFDEAKKIAENDPAVKGKIMNVEVFPYHVALMREVETK